MDTGRRTPSTSSSETVARHWYRDLSIRARIFGLTAVLLLGLVASTVTGLVNGNRASDLHAESQAAVAVQQEVEAARYDLLWAANWQNITAWRARVDGGAVAAAPDGDNVAFYTDGATGFEKLFAIDRSLLDSKAQASLDTIQENWTVMSDYNDQIFQLWAAGQARRGRRDVDGREVGRLLRARPGDDRTGEVGRRARHERQAAGRRRRGVHRDHRRDRDRRWPSCWACSSPSSSRAASSAGSRGSASGLERLAAGDLAVAAAGARPRRGRPDGGRAEQRRRHHGGHRRRDRRLGGCRGGESRRSCPRRRRRSRRRRRRPAPRPGVVSGAAEEVSRSVETVAAGAEQMGASIREIASNAAEASEVAARAVTAAEHDDGDGGQAR